MQNKLHEAQSLPRQYAGYYETLSAPVAAPGQRTPYRILFYRRIFVLSRRIVQIGGKNNGEICQNDHFCFIDNRGDP